MRKTSATLVSALGKAEIKGGSIFDTATQAVSGVRSAHESGHSDILCSSASFLLHMMVARRLRCLHARESRESPVLGYDSEGTPVVFASDAEAVASALYLAQPTNRGGLGCLTPPAYVFGGDNSPEHFLGFLAEVQSNPRSQSRDFSGIWEGASFVLKDFLGPGRDKLSRRPVYGTALMQSHADITEQAIIGASSLNAHKALMTMPPHPAWQWLLQGGSTDDDAIREIFEEAFATRNDCRIPLMAVIQLIDSFKDMTDNAVARAAASVRVLIAAGGSLDEAYERARNDNTA